MLSHTTMRDVTVRVHSNTQGYRPASRRGGRRRAASNSYRHDGIARQAATMTAEQA
jgi:hypothetical protein